MPSLNPTAVISQPVVSTVGRVLAFISAGVQTFFTSAEASNSSESTAGMSPESQPPPNASQ